MCCEFITIVKLINISSPHTVIFLVCVLRASEIYSHSKISVLNTVLLTIVTMLYITSLESVVPHNCNFVFFDQHIPSPCPDNHHSISVYLTF